MRLAYTPAAEEKRRDAHGETLKESRFHDQASLARLRVLVVDDETDAREMVRRLLEDWKAEVKTACTADEALAIIRTGWAEVMVSDIGMP